MVVCASSNREPCCGCSVQQVHGYAVRVFFSVLVYFLCIRQIVQTSGHHHISLLTALCMDSKDNRHHAILSAYPVH